MQCDFSVTSEQHCPDEAKFEARKGGHRYAVYCDKHVDEMTFLWLRYGLRIIARPLVEEVA